MIVSIIQTESERRKREAGVKQSMEIRLRSCMYVFIVYGYVCMVFGIISRTKAWSVSNFNFNFNFKGISALFWHGWIKLVMKK